MATNPTFASLPSAPSGANAKLPLGLTSEFDDYCSTANAGQSGRVRFGSKADMCSAQADVRLGPKADIARLFLLLISPNDPLQR